MLSISNISWSIWNWWVEIELKTGNTGHIEEHSSSPYRSHSIRAVIWIWTTLINLVKIGKVKLLFFTFWIIWFPLVEIQGIYSRKLWWLAPISVFKTYLDMWVFIRNVNNIQKSVHIKNSEKGRKPILYLKGKYWGCCSRTWTASIYLCCRWRSAACSTDPITLSFHLFLAQRGIDCLLGRQEEAVSTGSRLGAN